MTDRPCRTGLADSRTSAVAARLGALLLAATLAVAACSDPETGGPAATGQASTGGADQATTLIDAVAEDPTAGAPSVDDPYVGTFGNGGYDVSHYDLQLDWYPDERRLDGVARIEALATQDLSSFNLDLIALEVSSISVGGVDAAFEQASPELVVTPAEPLAAGAPFTVEVAYSGVPLDDADPVSADAGGWNIREDYVFVAGEPISASSFHPANDHPSDKASFGFTISAPEALTVVANGTLVSSDSSNGRTTWVYDAPHPQAPYLSTVLIGDFEVVEGGTTSSGVTIRDVYDADLDPDLFAFDLQPAMMDHFEELFGPYPFDIYGSAVVSDDSFGGALETQTLSVFSYHNAASEQIVAHELAHQWFGNHVSLARWEDLWLNEGFASYAEALWAAEADPGFEWEQWIFEVARAGIAQPIHPAPEELFTDAIYLRGALALHALRVEVGDEIFFEILREWGVRHGGSSASTADFQELAGELAGRDLTPLFDRWLRQAELPSSLDGVSTGGAGDDD